MKIILRILQIVLVLAVLVFFAGLLFVNQIGKRALPDYTATVDLRNMTGTVSVYRDDAAVPHIYAENEEDLYRTVGYVMAQDRLWQMDLLRRATTGRLSEIFGKDVADTDLMLRSLRIPDKSKSIMENLEPEIKLALMAFSDGVNQYIRNHGKKLPPEFTILGYEP